MKKFYLLFTALFCSLICHAQQEAQYSQYVFNSLVINPAYAGYKETLNVSMLNRDQWTGLDGSPKTQSLIVDGAFFDNRVGLGLSVINDKIGLQHQSSAFVNYSYRLPVGNDDSRLALGLAAGVSQYTLNANDAVIDDISDPNFAGKSTYFAPDAKLGVFYSSEKFFAGASITNLLANAIDYRNSGQGAIYKQGRHYFLSAGALLDINPSIKFKPSFLIKEDTKSPTNMDLNFFFLIKEAVWLGASYRTNVNLWKKPGLNTTAFNQNSLVGAVELFFARNIRVGYAYDYALSALGDYSNGTHEISLGFILNANRKSTALLTPRYF
ncbi:MAG: type secretion system rane protein PorP/SprF [Sphingobacteriaceae bacterium]|jgi:type IX secretion system PorP/SprF family membrane protein|nr:type secretion system rane protein PorP/SprF [Sphingobacteriaceae bacterium]